MTKEDAEKRTLRVEMYDGTVLILEFPTEEARSEALKMLDERIRAKKGVMYV